MGKLKYLFVLSLFTLLVVCSIFFYDRQKMCLSHSNISLYYIYNDGVSTPIQNTSMLYDNSCELLVSTTSFQAEAVSLYSVWIEPDPPVYYQEVSVKADVRGDVYKVYLNWTLDNAVFHYVEMILVSPLQTIYKANITEHPYGTTVYFRIEINDTSGVMYYSSWYYYVVSDDVAPVIYNSSYSLNRALTFEDIEFTINASDPDYPDSSGIYGVWLVFDYSNDNSSWVYYSSVSVPLDADELFKINISFTDAGFYRFYIYVEDVAGNNVREPESSYYFLEIIARKTKIIPIGDTNITVQYSDRFVIEVKLVDLNSSSPIANKDLQIYLIDNDGKKLVTTVKTNATGYAKISLLADIDVGNYTIEIFFDGGSSYLDYSLEIDLVIIPETVVIEPNYQDIQEENYEFEIESIKDDEDNMVFSGKIEIISNNLTLYELTINELTTYPIKIIINASKLRLEIIENETYGEILIVFTSKNYEKVEITILAKYRRSQVNITSLEQTIKQGENLSLTINVSDPDGIYEIYVLKDGKEIKHVVVMSYTYSLQVVIETSIGEKVGYHTILVKVVDILGYENEYDYQYYVEAANIIIGYEIYIKKTGEIIVNISATYDSILNNSDIRVMVYFNNYGVNATKNNTFFIAVFKPTRNGDIVIRIVASDKYGHKAEKTTVIKYNFINQQNNDITPYIPIILAIIGGSVATVLVLSKTLAKRKITEQPTVTEEEERIPEELEEEEIRLDENES